MDLLSIPSSDFAAMANENFSLHWKPSAEIDRRRAVLIGAYSLLLAVGGAANGYVALVLIRILRSVRSEPDSPHNIQLLIVALCLGDLLVLACSPLLILDLAHGRWVFDSPWLCAVYLFCESLHKFCSPFLLAALSFFCYLSIGSRRTFSRRTVAASIGVSVALALILNVPLYAYGDVYYVLFANNSQIYDIMPKCAFQPPEYVLTVFAVYTFILGYLAPTVAFTYFYLAILARVRRHAAQFSDNSLDVWRVAKTTLCLVTFYLFCWTPYYLQNLVEFCRPFVESPADISSPSDAVVTVGYTIHMLPYLNCSGYPILYTILNRSVRHAYRRVKSKGKRAPPIERSTPVQQRPISV